MAKFIVRPATSNRAGDFNKAWSWAQVGFSVDIRKSFRGANARVRRAAKIGDEVIFHMEEGPVSYTRVPDSESKTGFRLTSIVQSGRPFG